MSIFIISCYWLLYIIVVYFFFSSRRRHTSCALVTGVQTCALPISDYALPLLIEISPPVDEASLRLAFNAVIQRHDVLRASFPLKIGRASCRERVCQYV